MKKTKFIIGSIILVLLFAIGVYSIKPLLNITHYGLDLQGGFEILYQVESLDGKKLDNDMLYSTYKAIGKRIDILGVSEPEISIEGNDRIRIKLAGVTNADDARKMIASTATLSFRDYNDNLLMTSEVLGGSAKETTDTMGRQAVSVSIKDTSTFYDVTKKVSTMTNNIIVIWLDYDETTDSYVKERGLCGSSISHCLSAATVDRGFASDVIISGNFTKKEAKTLVDLINSGALPTKLTELSSHTVEASFGELSLSKTLVAGLIGIVLVMILMVVIYKFCGLVAGFGITLYTILSFLIFYLINGVLTLPGIAALLLGIGMAVDASIISFERIKENILIGKSIDKSFDLGNKNSFSSIVDANITTIIAAVILFILGDSSIRGFATMLIINVLVTIFVMVFLTKVIIKYFIKTKVFDNKPYLFIGVKKNKIEKSSEIKIPYEKINIVKTKKYSYLLTIMLIIVMSGLFIYRGINLGIDFSGGTSISINTKDTNTDLNTIKKDLTSYHIIGESTNNDIISIDIKETLNEEEIKNLGNKLQGDYNVDTEIYAVSNIVKQELVKNAIKSLIFASIGIVIYVSIRFKFNYAVAAIIALIHDVLMVFLFFGATHLKITSIFIAALLTIIGYSINDTIVTFDMVRENYKNKYKNKCTDEELENLVNISVRRTLYRTILTTITTIVPVICLMVFGSHEIMNFNIALLVGFIVGVYSSIFISNNIWLYLEKRRIHKPIKEDKDLDDINELKIKGINC
mgnify:FL=1